MDWGTLFFVAVVVMLTAPAMIKARRTRLDQEQGVLAQWERLRITRTELIEGYRHDANRRPLDGLTARVDDSNGRVSVIVEGPDTHITESKRFGNFLYLVPHNPTDTAAKFVQAFNIASEQAAWWSDDPDQRV